MPISLRGIITAALLATLAAALPGPAEAGSFGFGEPKAVNGNYMTTTRSNYSPDVAGSGDTWVAVWHTADNVVGLGNDTNIFSSSSFDNGETWTAPVLVNSSAMTYGGSDFGGRIDIEEGVWIATWVSWANLGGSNGTEGDILYSRSVDDGLTWEADRALNTNATSDSGWDTLPSVRPAGGGVWIAFWSSQENLGGVAGSDWDVFFSRSTNDGQTWSAPAVLNSTAATNNVGGYVLVEADSDRSGVWVAAWGSRDDLGGTIGNDYDILFARSEDNGLSWSETRALNSNAASDTLDDGNLLTAGTTGPSVRTDRNGNWVAVWSSLDPLDGTLGTDGDILFARSADNGLTWTDPLPLNSNAAADPEGLAGSDTSPWLATDQLGNWVTVWLSTAFSGPSFGDLDLAISKSTDNGATWTPIAPLNLTSTADSVSYDELPRFVTNGSGTWMCTWMGNLAIFGGDFLYDANVAISTDISLPASPPFWNKEIETLIYNLILGYQIVDVNGDGRVDAADLLLATTMYE